MKRLLSFLLAAVMMTALTVPANAAEPGITMADVTVQDGDKIAVPVSLQKEVTGMAMSLIYDYDADVLEILLEECTWIPEGVMSDFSPEYQQAAWASQGPVALSGEICVLVFRILDMEAFARTEVSCQVTVEDGPDTVGAYEDAAQIVKVRRDLDGNGHEDEMDAFYLLWHTLFPREYPLDTTLADFDCDERVTDADAVVLLWNALFPESK